MPISYDTLSPPRTIKLLRMTGQEAARRTLLAKIIHPRNRNQVH
jgi:hypothetical protein